MRMISLDRRRFLVRALSTFVAAAVTVAVVGCGDDGLGKRYPVKGKVTYKGELVKDGSISFRPVGGEAGSESRGAIGRRKGRLL